MGKHSEPFVEKSPFTNHHRFVKFEDEMTLKNLAAPGYGDSSRFLYVSS